MANTFQIASESFFITLGKLYNEPSRQNDGMEDVKMTERNTTNCQIEVRQNDGTNNQRIHREYNRDYTREKDSS